jgi:hypothetical protein
VRSLSLAAAGVALICLVGVWTMTASRRRAAQADRPVAGAERPPGDRDASAPDVRRLTARTLRVYNVPEAGQGVAADARFFYPVNNTVLAKYEIASGQLVDRWDAPPNGLIRHLNSCLADDGRVWCANSNYPLTPMGSSLEVFDAASLDPVSSHSFGMRDEGSLTWMDRYDGGWLAGFAHYDENGGVKFKDHRFSSAVTFDAEWRRKGGWLFPQSTIDRMAPSAASGGAIGPDGWLYLLGHNRPEMYVVARPSMGPTLIHIATIELEVEGQAFSWAKDGTRTVFTIDRGKSLVRSIEIPAVTPADAATALRFR